MTFFKTTTGFHLLLFLFLPSRKRLRDYPNGKNFFRAIDIMKTEDIMNDETIESVVEAIVDMNESKLKQAASFVELEKILDK